MVESQPSKLLVAGSIPVSRSRLRRFAGVTLSGVEGASPQPNPERCLRGISAEDDVELSTSCH